MRYTDSIKAPVWYPTPMPNIPRDRLGKFKRRPAPDLPPPDGMSLLDGVEPVEIYLVCDHEGIHHLDPRWAQSGDQIIEDGGYDNDRPALEQLPNPHNGRQDPGVLLEDMYGWPGGTTHIGENGDVLHLGQPMGYKAIIEYIDSDTKLPM